MAELKAKDETINDETGVKEVTQKEFEALQEQDPRYNDASRRADITPLILAPQAVAVDAPKSPHKDEKAAEVEDDGSHGLTSAEIASLKLNDMGDADKFAEYNLRKKDLKAESAKAEKAKLKSDHKHK